MANFFIRKNETFKVTIPFDCSDPTAPLPIIGDSIDSYVSLLKGAKEEHLQYHWCLFRRPDWGLDCFLRELAYSGVGQQRTFSPEKLLEARSQYLLLGSSLFDTPPALVRSERYEVLNAASLEYLRSLDPTTLRVFFMIGAAVWDNGISPRMLLSEEDYKLLRNDPEGLTLVMRQKGLLTDVAGASEEDKKKS